MLYSSTDYKQRLIKRGKMTNKLIYRLTAVALIASLLFSSANGIVHGDTSNGSSISYSEPKITDSELGQLLDKITKEFGSDREIPSEDMKLRSKQIQMLPEQTHQMELLYKNGTKVEGVIWFAIVRYPENAIYLGGDNRMTTDGANFFLSENGLITALKPGDFQVWAKVGDYLYRSSVKIESPSEHSASNKIRATDTQAEAIAQKFQHLDDLDKILLVHNYLIEKIDYDLSLQYNQFHEYNALVEGKAVCYGYARAFGLLMNKLGVETVTETGRMTSNPRIRHAWNRVKINGKWYFIDLTWDDGREKEDLDLRYRNFMIDEETLIKNDHTRDGWSESSNLGGKEFMYYPHIKRGIFAATDHEIDEIVLKQLDMSNGSSYTARLYVPESDGQREEFLREYIQSVMLSTAQELGANVERVSKKVTVGDYTLYEYTVSGLSTDNQSEVRFENAEISNNEEETTHSITLSFNKSRLGLQKHNIAIVKSGESANKKRPMMDATIESLALVNDDGASSTYELKIKDILVEDGENLDIIVTKRGLNFENDRRSITVNISKEETPTAVFEATGFKEGLLRIEESGVRFTTGDGIWQETESGGTYTVNTVYGKPIVLYKKSTSDGKLRSDSQRINVEYQPYPDWVTSEPATKGQNDGKILGVSSQYQYKHENSQDWIDVASGAQEVIGLPAGNYKVRLKPNGLTMASQPFDIVIGETETSTDATTTNNGASDGASSGAAGGTSSSASGGNISGGAFGSTTGTSIGGGVSDGVSDGVSGGISGSGGASGGTSGENVVSGKIETTDSKTTNLTSSETNANRATKKISNFEDIQNHWAKAAIAVAVENNIFNGVSEKSFAPDNSVSRGMFVTILGRLANAETAENLGQQKSFADIDYKKYYAPYAEWAKQNNIVTGIDAAIFAPDAEITREQVAVILVRYLRIRGIAMEQKESTAEFADSEQISAWAREAVQIMQSLGLFTGRSDNKFMPKDPITRAEIAVIASRLVKIIK